MEIQSSHDKFFKETFGTVEIVRDFLENYLPQGILRDLALYSLELQKDSFITANLRESFSDLIFKARFNKKEGYLCFLFEHKSYLYPDLIFQLLKYMAEIWTAKLRKEEVALPIILPIVIYHGPRPWNIKTSLSEMLPNFSKLSPQMKEHVPNFSYLLYNLPELVPTELKGGPFLRITISSLKVIFSISERYILREVNWS